MYPEKLTRIGIFLCGITGFILTTCVILPESAERIVISFFSEEYFTQLPVILSMLVSPTISLAVSWYLVANSNRISQRLFPECDPTPDQIERAMYRVTLTAVAVLVITGTLSRFIHAFGLTVIEQYELDNAFALEQTFSYWNAPYLIAFAFKLVVGAYLICGAPHLVNWQMQQSNGETTKQPIGIIHFLIVMITAAIILGIALGGLNFHSVHR